MRVLDDVGDAVDAPARHLRRLQFRQDFGEWQSGRPGLDGRVQLGGARRPAGVVGEGGIGGEIVAAHRAHQPPEDAVRISADDHPGSVLAAIGVRRSDPWQSAAAPLTHVAGHGVLRKSALQHAEDRLVEGDVDDLSLATVGLTLLQRDQGADHPIQRRQRIAQAHPGPRRRPVGMSGQIAQAAHRLAGGAEPRPIAVGSGLSVSREANQDEAGIVARQLLVAETPLLQRPGTEILDDHVGTPRERANDLLPFLRF